MSVEASILHEAPGCIYHLLIFNTQPWKLLWNNSFGDSSWNFLFWKILVWIYLKAKKAFLMFAQLYRYLNRKYKYRFSSSSIEDLKCSGISKILPPVWALTVHHSLEKKACKNSHSFWMTLYLIILIYLYIFWIVQITEELPRGCY